MKPDPDIEFAEELTRMARLRGGEQGRMLLDVADLARNRAAARARERRAKLAVIHDVIPIGEGEEPTQ